MVFYRADLSPFCVHCVLLLTIIKTVADTFYFDTFYLSVLDLCGFLQIALRAVRTLLAALERRREASRETTYSMRCAHRVATVTKLGILEIESR